MLAWLNLFLGRKRRSGSASRFGGASGMGGNYCGASKKTGWRGLLAAAWVLVVD